MSAHQQNHMQFAIFLVLVGFIAVLLTITSLIEFVLGLTLAVLPGYCLGTAIAARFNMKAEKRWAAIIGSVFVTHIVATLVIQLLTLPVTPVNRIITTVIILVPLLLISFSRQHVILRQISLNIRRQIVLPVFLILLAGFTVGLALHISYVSAERLYSTAVTQFWAVRVSASQYTLSIANQTDEPALYRMVMHSNGDESVVQDDIYVHAGDQHQITLTLQGRPAPVVLYLYRLDAPDTIHRQLILWPYEDSR